MKYRYYESPVGMMLLASEDDRLSGAWFLDQRYYPSVSETKDSEDPDDPVLTDAVCWLDRYFAGEKVSPKEIPLKLDGTEFRKKVWDMLLDIPYGETVTYGKLAKALGNNMSSQAVGGAVGHNPISVIVPCHRVIGADGSLIGYAAGTDKKRFLLDLENHDR